MSKLYKILRSILVSLAVLLLVLPVLTYVIVSLTGVERKLVSIAEKELTELINAKVTIASADIRPFNRVALNNVSVVVAPGDTALKVRRIGAGIRLDQLLLKQKIVVSYIVLLGPDFAIHQDTSGAPLNIDPIIKKLSGNQKKGKKPFELAINSIVIRRGKINFRNLSDTTESASEKINFSDIAINNFKADLKLPLISDKKTIVRLKRLSLDEQSGFSIKSMAANLAITDSALELSDFDINLIDSHLSVDSAYITRVNGKIDGDSRLYMRVNNDSYISTIDAKYFFPAASKLNSKVFPISVNLTGRLENFTVFDLRAGGNTADVSLEIAHANVSGLPNADSLKVDLPAMKLTVNVPTVLGMIGTNMPVRADSIGIVNISGNANLNAIGHSSTALEINSASGNAKLTAAFNGNIRAASGTANVGLMTRQLNLRNLTNQQELGPLTADLKVTGTVSNKSLTSASVTGSISELTYKLYNYTAIRVEGAHNRNQTSGTITAADPNLNANLHLELQHEPRQQKQIKSNIRINTFNPYALNLTSAYEDYKASATAIANASFDNIDNLDGKFEIFDFKFDNDRNEGVDMNYMMLLLSGGSPSKQALLHSDIIDGRMIGQYKLSKIKSAVIQCLSPALPALFAETAVKNNSEQADTSNLHLNIDLRANHTMSRWLAFLKSPVNILHPANISASLNSTTKLFNTTIKAPYLLKGDKFIDSTFVTFSANGNSGHTQLNASTVMPSKQGPATIGLNLEAHDNNVNVEANWLIDAKKHFAGLLNADIGISKTPAGAIALNAHINPSDFVINDTTWIVHPATIDIANNSIEINDFNVSGSGQHLKIDGVVSDNPFNTLALDLLNIDLGYVFEILNINHVTFGGRATGHFTAANLLTKEPSIATPRLHVDNFSYNGSVLGDTDIESHWDTSTHGIVLNADVHEENKHESHINGAIYPLADSLDLVFTADSLNIGFLQPFMEAFSSDVSGHASGRARLFGTFKNINLEGKLLTDKFRLKINFTNTYYSTSDSINIVPNQIQLNNLHITDDYGNTALLNGVLKHDCFHTPEFEFRITDARKLMCLDVNSQQNPDWYGRIFCNGNATLKGVPGRIDINVDISTAPNSIFTFALNDNITADEYAFLQFNNRHQANTDLLLAVEHPEDANIQRIKQRIQQQNALLDDETASVYNINLQLNATPDGEMNLIMDPVSGDKIRAWGNGNLRIAYNSTADQMKMFGTYTLTHGTYNFTLQDIIIKDFTITPGSAITFRGDPLAAQLNIEAAYQLNANLSDLDESFMQDKELNRTNVPVQALLLVEGDMQQPDISFDLRFPTLTQDVYRKVKSIVSTPEMMNRQIIYLLALNRFYTPDYMASATRGNELMSVASSTISSQLSNILGQISDKWTISPNFRSSKGDFSDMEVDLALSSHLLNNRLLFNGNFGYRDKSLNNNTFIGDFDIEYLLNRSGNIRLKAYNRYNDQNYFVRSALTTQGVGVVFKHEFDNLFNFFKKNKKKKEQSDTIAPQSSDTTLLDFKKRTPVTP